MPVNRCAHWVTVRTFAVVPSLDSVVGAGVTCAVMLVRLLSVVLLASLFLPQVGRAHVHLCLDGAGPAVSMHMPDTAGQCQHVEKAGHHDHAVDADSPVIGKLWPPGVDAALVDVLILVVLAPRLPFAPVSPDRLTPDSTPYLRPPLRGPPA